LNLPLCLDGRMLKPGGTGISSYARLLSNAQATLTDASFILMASRARIPKLLAAASLLPAKTSAALPPAGASPGTLLSPDIFRRAYVHFSLYGRLMPLMPPFARGVMHWTYPVPMTMVGWANVYSVHDAIPLSSPHLTGISATRLRRTLTAIAKVADRIVTISESARADILAQKIFPPASVIDCGIPVELPDRTEGEGRLPDGLHEKGYFFFFGSIEPRKNIARLLQAYRASGTAMPLVIAGPDGWNSAAILREIARTHKVIRLPYQSADTIALLMTKARAVLFPSLAEGFGLPVVEAMARGTPVLTSSIPALIETAGGAALLVDPLDATAIANGITRLATDDALVERLIRSGTNRVLDFPPTLFTRRIADVYRAIVAERGWSP
jgi:glycosyltransferase involved in cell wall biosynthesis